MYWSIKSNYVFSLSHTVPPKKITIRDQNGNYIENSTIGPYDQNTDVILTCESNGGKVFVFEKNWFILICFVKKFIIEKLTN